MLTDYEKEEIISVVQDAVIDGRDSAVWCDDEEPDVVAEEVGSSIYDEVESRLTSLFEKWEQRDSDLNEMRKLARNYEKTHGGSNAR